jgi:hypothetical protein
LRPAVEALFLEAAEQDGPLGPSTVLVLDRPGQREQRGFAQNLRLQPGVTAAQGREHRRVFGRPPGGGLGDGRGQAQTGRPLPLHLLHQREVVLAVPPVPSGHPLRPGKAVPRFPAAQRGRRQAAAVGQLANGHSVGRFAHRQNLSLCMMPNLL